MTTDKSPDSSRSQARSSGRLRLPGLLTTAELVTAGLTAARIRTLVRRQVLVPVGHGLYARAALVAALVAAAAAADGQSGEHLLQVAAAVALTGPGAAGSHHDAALIHRLDLPDSPSADFVTVTCPPGAAGSRTGRPRIRVHNAALPPSQVTTRHGIRVTSAARTVIDLARSTSVRSGVVTACGVPTGRLPEADGAAKYSNPDRARLQLQRDAGLREAGFEVVHFTWKQLHIAPGQVAHSIRAAFRRGASH